MTRDADATIHVSGRCAPPKKPRGIVVKQPWHVRCLVLSCRSSRRTSARFLAFAVGCGWRVPFGGASSDPCTACD